MSYDLPDGCIPDPLPSDLDCVGDWGDLWLGVIDECDGECVKAFAMFYEEAVHRF